MTTKQRNKDRFVAVCSEVSEYLQLTEYEVFELILESGCQYLESRLPATVASVYKSSEMFWTWWRMEFMLKWREMYNKRTVRCASNIAAELITLPYYPGKHITSKILQNGTK